MTMRMRAAVAMLAAALAGCDRGSGSAQADQAPEQARRDSAVSEQKALRDSGVTVDTQVIDTGGPATAHPEDN
jgi:hypothetical protein